MFSRRASEAATGGGSGSGGGGDAGARELAHGLRRRSTTRLGSEGPACGAKATGRLARAPDASWLKELTAWQDDNLCEAV